MKQLTYIAVDDTDEQGSPLSTGKMADRLAAFLRQRYQANCSFVSRHQLLLDDRINYTSHNSAMCFTVCLDDDQRQALIAFAEGFLATGSAASAEPGFAVAVEAQIAEPAGLIAFGQRAKTDYLTVEDAEAEAARQQIFLVGLKHQRRGMIGALAAIGLRLTGNDGRVKGKFVIADNRAEVRQILADYPVDAVVDEAFKPLSDPSAQIIFSGPMKLIVYQGRAVLPVCKGADGWRARRIDELRVY